jgi:hypothetical protein
MTDPSQQLILFENKLARKREYWQFVKMVAPSGKEKPQGGWKAQDCVALYCEKCNLQMKYTVNDSKVIRRHMHRAHSDEMMEYKNKTTILEKTKRKTMDDFLCATAKKPKTAPGSTELKQLKALCVKWVSKNYRPIQIVEDDGLIELIHFANRMKNFAVLPGRTSLSEEIRETAEIKRTELKTILVKEAKFYCTTTDIWSSRSSSAFISLTMHYLTDDFTMKSWNLEVQKFGGKHSVERIAEMLDTSLAIWNLKKENMVLMIRDNASNGVSGTNAIQVTSLGSIPHSLHLVLGPLFFPKKKRNRAAKSDDSIVTLESMERFEAAMDEDEKTMIESLADRIKLLRDLAKYFTKSTKGAEKLRLLQSGKQLGCTMDVVTRWGSSFKMLERLVRLRAPIESFLAYTSTPEGRKEFDDFKKRKPTGQDWFVIEALLPLLKPFEVATAILSREKYCTIAHAFPVLHLIKRKVSDPTVFDAVHSKYTTLGLDVDVELVKKVQQYIIKHFCKRFNNLPIYIVASSVLHPGYSKMAHLTEVERRDCQEFIVREMIAMNKASNDDVCGEGSTDDVTSPSDSENAMIRELYGVGVDDEDENRRSSLDEAEDQATLNLRCLAELKMYIDVAKAFVSDKSTSNCPLQWWKENKSSFKLLAPVARKWLGCLASSVPSERAFSSAGNTVSAKRASLGDDMVRDLVFLHDNNL